MENKFKDYYTHLDIKFKHDLFLHENRGHDFTSPFTIPNDSASLGDILHYYNLPVWWLPRR